MVGWGPSSGLVVNDTVDQRHVYWSGHLESCSLSLNSLKPCAAYMRQWTNSALVQVMAYRLFGAKPLPKPMLVYYQWTLGNKFQSDWNSISYSFLGGGGHHFCFTFHWKWFQCVQLNMPFFVQVIVWRWTTTQHPSQWWSYICVCVTGP